MHVKIIIIITIIIIIINSLKLVLYIVSVYKLI